MRKLTRWMPLGLAALAAAASGCGGDDTGSGGGSHAHTTTTTTNTAGQPAVDITVDADRDGVADLANQADQDHEDEPFSVQFGASFLANIDDDDADGVRDCDDTKVNGDADLLDLARVQIAAWPEAPDGTVATLTIDAASADSVRVFAHSPADGQWYLVAGALDACLPDTPCNVAPVFTLQIGDLRAGLELGIESRRFRVSSDPAAWSGVVQLDYKVVDGAGQPVVSDGAPDGTDHVKLRVAPWMLNGNLSPFDRVWSSNDSSAFVKGIKAATDASTAAGQPMEHRTYSNWGDQWTQDFFQTGWTAIPGPNGAVQGMRVANARPWGRANGEKNWPITWLMKNYLGPDQAVEHFYKKPDTGDSYDSHGNHDLIPPYDNGDQHFPAGRIFVGSGVLPETKEFYDAQQVQGPHFSVKTSWLLVGHIDEVFSYVPAATPRGWKLLVGSPKLAKQMLEAQSAAGNGAVEMFIGLKHYEGNSLVSATVTIDEALADVDLMQWSQEGQTEIDGMLADIQAEVGLADDEIIEIPYLFEEVCYGGCAKVAWSPGTVNLLAFHDFVVHPKPFGPKIGGVDMFEKDLQDRLGTAENKLGKDGKGLEVYFADDWNFYHILDGEVHCGSNPEAPAPFSDVRWWETGR